MLAVIASSNAPLLLLDADLAVIAASATFCRALRIDPAGLEGRKLFDLGDGEWNVPQPRSPPRTTDSGHAQIEAYEIDLAPKANRAAALS